MMPVHFMQRMIGPRPCGLERRFAHGLQREYMWTGQVFPGERTRVHGS